MALVTYDIDRETHTGDDRWFSGFVRDASFNPKGTFRREGFTPPTSFWPFWGLFFAQYKGNHGWLPPAAPSPVPPAQPAKVVMLGTSGAGKTCFMAAMYNVMESGVQGFSLSTTDLDQGAALNEVFQTLRREEGEARWPKGTAQGTLFRFEFNHHHQKIAAFDWLDYRGGALKDKASEADVKALLQHLTESFAVLIAIDGEILNKTDDELDADDSLGVKRINQFLRRAADAALAAGRRLPLICLVITKGDAIMEGDEAARTARLEAVKHLYNGITMDSSGWDVHLTAVSLGEGLHEDKQRKIRPVGVHDPICHIAWQWFERELQREDDRTRAQREELKDWLAFAQRHKTAEGVDQGKMSEFVAHVNSVLLPYENALADLRKKLLPRCESLRSVCGRAAQPSPAAGETSSLAS